jgi:hypothetical protein
MSGVRWWRDGVVAARDGKEVAKALPSGDGVVAEAGVMSDAVGAPLWLRMMW